MRSRNPRRDRAMLRMYLTGCYSQTQVAQAFGIKSATASAALARRGATTDHRIRAAVGLARALLPQAVPGNAIAEALGVNRDTLSAWLSSNGISLSEWYDHHRNAMGLQGAKMCSTCRRDLPIDRFPLKHNSRRGAAQPIGRCRDCERDRVRRAVAKRKRQVMEEGSDYERRRVWHGAKEARAMGWREHLRRVERALPPSPPDPESIPRPYREPCPACGADVPHGRRKYCSTRCGWRVLRQKRRARYRRAFVEDVSYAYIYSRDGGLCQLCGRPVKRSAQYPDPGAGVLDHIVPLSRGGKHERRNLQLAHHGCNDRKGAGSAGSQLLLVG